MTVVTIICVVLSCVFQIALAIAAYFVCRFALARASEWHVKQGGKALSDKWQKALSVLVLLSFVF